MRGGSEYSWNKTSKCMYSNFKIYCLSCLSSTIQIYSIQYFQDGSIYLSSSVGFPSVTPLLISFIFLSRVSVFYLVSIPRLSPSFIYSFSNAFSLLTSEHNQLCMLLFHIFLFEVEFIQLIITLFSAI